MRAWIALALIAPLVALAQTPGFDEERGERGDRVEAPLQLPPYPKPENYLPFELNVTTPFAFFVDAMSISVAADGVVRYTVIAKSAGGALNISYEGMRCAKREFRVYALGSVDNSWFQVRHSQWEPIGSEPRNAQRSVLYSDYFCPMSGNIATAEQGVRALKMGGAAGVRSNRIGY